MLAPGEVQVSDATPSWGAAGRTGHQVGPPLSVRGRPPTGSLQEPSSWPRTFAGCALSPQVLALIRGDMIGRKAV